VIGVRARPLPCCGQYGSGQRLEILQPLFHIRAHIYELEMWQEVRELVTEFTVVAEHCKFGADDIRDPAVGVAVEMGAHVSEDGGRHVWMGFQPSLCRSGQFTGPEGVSSGSTKSV